jgi:hypothetical protein
MKCIRYRNSYMCVICSLQFVMYEVTDPSLVLSRIHVVYL